MPVAGLAQVLTAYVVLSDHPLATGNAQGPSIPVNADTLTSYQAGLANQESRGARHDWRVAHRVGTRSRAS